MAQRKSDCRWRQAFPAYLSIAKSVEAEKAGTTQHSPKQLSQSPRRLRRALSARCTAWSHSSDTVRDLPSMARHPTDACAPAGRRPDSSHVGAGVLRRLRQMQAGAGDDGDVPRRHRVPGRAAYLGADRLSTGAMREHHGRPDLVGCPDIAPVEQRDESGVELAALAGKAVFVAGALPRLAVGGTGQ